MRQEIVSILYCVTSCVKVLKVEMLPRRVLSNKRGINELLRCGQQSLRMDGPKCERPITVSGLSSGKLFVL